MRWMLYFAFSGLALLFVAPPASACSNDAIKSTAYIIVETTDFVTGAKTTIQGSGFAVSRDGYILTAAHLLNEWRKHPDYTVLRASLGDKPPPDGPGILLNLDVVKGGDPDAEDVALLKLPPANSPQGYPIAPYCPETPRLGEQIIALGFATNSGLQPTWGILGMQNATGGRWRAAITFAEGMSGGPVYNSSCNLVGLVKGGAPSTPNMNSVITPINHANTFLSTANTVKQCPVTGYMGPPETPQKDAVPLANPWPQPEIVASPRLLDRFRTVTIDAPVDSVVLRVLDASSREPIPNVPVAIYENGSDKPYASGNTAPDGKFMFRPSGEQFLVEVAAPPNRDFLLDMVLPKTKRNLARK